MKTHFKHKFVQIFGGSYYDNKNHEIANCYYYTGEIPLWINMKTYNIRHCVIRQWYSIQILYYVFRLYLKKKRNEDSL
jgi:hypothetical protein